MGGECFYLLFFTTTHPPTQNEILNYVNYVKGKATLVYVTQFVRRDLFDKNISLIEL